MHVVRRDQVNRGEGKREQRREKEAAKERSIDIMLRYHEIDNNTPITPITTYLSVNNSQSEYASFSLSPLAKKTSGTWVGLIPLWSCFDCYSLPPPSLPPPTPRPELVVFDWARLSVLVTGDRRQGVFANGRHYFLERNYSKVL